MGTGDLAMEWQLPLQCPQVMRSIKSKVDNESRYPSFFSYFKKSFVYSKSPINDDFLFVFRKVILKAARIFGGCKVMDQAISRVKNCT